LKKTIGVVGNEEEAKWPIVQLFAINLRHRMNFWLKIEERLREAEYKKSLEVGQVVHFCEPEQGTILGEDEYGDEERPDVSPMENSDHHKERMLEASKENQESHIFKTNELCMYAGIEECEDR
jgi:hypothetical protein